MFIFSYFLKLNINNKKNIEPEKNIYNKIIFISLSIKNRTPITKNNFNVNKNKINYQVKNKNLKISNKNNDQLNKNLKKQNKNIKSKNNSINNTDNYSNNNKNNLTKLKNLNKKNTFKSKSLTIIKPYPINKDSLFKYNKIALRLHLEGSVVLKLFINKFGKVINVVLIKSSGSKILDNIAIKDAYRLIFKPKMINNQPVDSIYIIKIIFKIKDDL